jgi:hypothetical protein
MTRCYALLGAVIEGGVEDGGWSIVEMFGLKGKSRDKIVRSSIYERKAIEVR